MKKFKISILVVLIMFMLTGCGNSNYIMDNKKPVENEATGQILQKDILCKPEDKELDELYTKYKKQLKNNYDKLPKCVDFKVNSTKSSGLWEGVFVKPLAFIILKLGYLINNFGLAVILVGLAIRLILMPISRKTMKQSNNMKKAQPELARIEKKYANRTDNEAMMAKSQEMMMVYKKYNINPVSGCLVSFIQLPLFFAFLEAINRVPAIFEEHLFGVNLGTNSLIGITTGSMGVKIVYIVIILLIMLTTYLSFKMNMAASGGGEAEKQMQMMSKFMMIMISVISITLPVAIALYWIVTNGIMVLQNLYMKKIKSKK